MNHFLSKAQTGEFVFINNNSGCNASTLDVEVRVMPEDTVYALYTGVSYLGASTPITIPAKMVTVPLSDTGLQSYWEVVTRNMPMGNRSGYTARLSAS